MQIIIVGCGKVGMTLAEQLTNEGHNLVMIDTILKKFRKFQKNMTSWASWEMVPVFLSCRRQEWNKQIF